MQTFKIQLIQKTELIPNILEYKLKTENPISFIPGQFLNIAVTPPYKRPYSIINIEGDVLTLLVDIRSPGKGADFFRNLQIAEETTAMGPLGRFVLKDTPDNKVFIATGSGIAPFVPMLHQLKNQNFSGNIKLYFGMRFLSHDPIAYTYIKEFVDDYNFEYIRCISKPEGEYLKFEFGRVTYIVPEQNLDWQNTEFYICGSNDMVKEMRTKLLEKGATKIYLENYG